MKFPWERTDEKKASDSLSTEMVRTRLSEVMDELRETLEAIEHEMLENRRGG